MKSRLEKAARIIRILAQLENFREVSASVSDEADIRRVKQMIQAIRRLRTAGLDERSTVVLEFLEKNLRELL